MIPAELALKEKALVGAVQREECRLGCLGYLHGLFLLQIQGLYKDTDENRKLEGCVTC